MPVRPSNQNTRHLSAITQNLRKSCADPFNMRLGTFAELNIGSMIEFPASLSSAIQPTRCAAALDF
jgi:hypothetical protein